MTTGHPYEPTMAVSGIDHTIKIFSPDSRDQRNARKGIGVQSSDPGGFSSLNWGRRRRTQATEDEHDQRPAEALSDSDEEVSMNGLRSRKRMHEAYQITSQNDMDRKGGREDYFISVSRLLTPVVTFANYI
jgi:nuclear receptor interaction protein